MDLLEINPQYALIRHPDGREDTVALRHLAPYPVREDNGTDEQPTPTEPVDVNADKVTEHVPTVKNPLDTQTDVQKSLPRRSNRVFKPRDIDDL